eukprot:1161345-Pelagomonas_calceolata.AAC.14
MKPNFTPLHYGTLGPSGAMCAIFQKGCLACRRALKQGSMLIMEEEFRSIWGNKNWTDRIRGIDNLGTVSKRAPLLRET